MIMSNMDDKKDLIQFGFDKKIELAKINQSFFIDKQKIMNENTKFLWALKNKYQDKTHNHQLERMNLALNFKLKINEK